MKPQDNSARNMNLASVEEVRNLRKQVAELRKQVDNSPKVAKSDGPSVEVRLDPRTFPCLRNLLVATENYFGPETGKDTPKASKELRKAMEAAEQVIRPKAVTMVTARPAPLPTLAAVEAKVAAAAS